MQVSKLSRKEVDQVLKLARSLRGRRSEIEQLLGTRLLVYIASKADSYYDVDFTVDEDFVLQKHGSRLFVDRNDLSGGSSYFCADKEQDFPFISALIDSKELSVKLLDQD